MNEPQTLYFDAGPLCHDRMYRVVLHLNGSVLARFCQFLERQEFIGMSSSEIIGIFLDRVDTCHEDLHSYAAKITPIFVTNASPIQQLQEQEGQQQREQEEEQEQEQSPPNCFPASSLVVPSIPQQLNSGFGQNSSHCDAGQEVIAVYLDENGDIVPVETWNENHAGAIAAAAIEDQYGTSADVENHMPDCNQIGEESQNEFSVATIQQRQQWSPSLRHLLYGKVVQWHQDGILHCRLCSTSMTVVEGGVGLRAGNAFDHVCKHFNKSLFSCRICGHGTVSSLEMRDHIRTVHQADIRSNVDWVTLHQMEFEQMIMTCFENSADFAHTASLSEMVVDCQATKNRKKRRTCPQPLLQNGAVRMMDSTTSPRQLCYQLITKWQRENALFCKLCCQWVRVGAKTTWLRSDSAVQHACSHLGRPLYTCKLCSHSTPTCRQIRQHLQTAHKSRLRGQYVDLSENAQQELKAIITCCYDWDETEGVPPLEERRFLRNRLRPGLENNSHRRQELSHCRRLIRQFSVNSRIDCQLCGISLVVMTGNGYPVAETVYNHSLKHLDPSPYACRVCSKRTHNPGNMRTHIWSKHKGVPLTEFDDYTGELHDEIMTVLDECFAANESTDTEEMDSTIDNMVIDDPVGQPGGENLAHFSMNENAAIMMDAPTY